LEERRSYSNLLGSTALHGALLALLLLGFASAPKFADTPEAIPIETVSLSELNQIANGEKDAKPAPQPAPAPPTPPPDLRASVEPTPPPQPAPSPPPKPETTPPPKAENPPQKPTPPQKVDATPPPDPEPMPPERPEPPPPPKLAIQEATVQPPARPKFTDPASERPKEPAPEKPKPSHNFDPNMIAKLIGQGKTSTPAIASTQTAAATPQGLPHHDAPHMSMSMASALDAWLTESYLSCWTPPPSMPDGDTYVAQIKVVFNPDGSLSGHPVLINPPTDRAWRAHAESAMRAVRKCDPLKVPAEYMPFFEQWKVETIHFDPRETQG
jgi:outer membrane biosynthesis protein TonB